MDMKRITAMVKIKLQMIRNEKKQEKLKSDLTRLMTGLSNEEYNEYLKRIA